MTIRAHCLLIALFACSALTPHVYAADWPQFRGPNRDGKSAETGLLKQWPENGPTLLWTYDQLPKKGYASLCIVQNRIYTTGLAGKHGVLYALDTKGNLVYKVDYGPEWTRSFPSTHATPTYDNGRLYLLTGLGNLICFNADSGDIVWDVNILERFHAKNITWGLAESPLVVDNMVICTPGGGDALMAALDKDSGAPLWTAGPSHDKTQASYASAILVPAQGRRLAVNITAWLVFAVDIANGQILWHEDIMEYQEEKRGVNPNSPVHQGGRVFTTSGYKARGAMRQLAPDGGSAQRLWISDTLNTHHGHVVWVSDYLYGSNWHNNAKGSWVCLDAKTGQVKYDAPWQTKGSIIYADGMLYCYEEKKGHLALVRATPDAFDVVSSFQITGGAGEHWAHPAIANGTLYIRHGNALQAFDIKDRNQ